MRSVVLTTFLIIAATYTSVADEGFCGLEKPESGKTCVSFRLPWKPEPIYFCTEKFEHQSACGQNYLTPTACLSQYTNTSLLIATPWDCCPLQSQPVIGKVDIDVCKNAHCVPKPSGRTCVDLRKNSVSSSRINNYYYGQRNCCPKWFCEEGVDLENPSCSLKVLEPGCKQAPKNKTNCTIFHDEYGCCPKFQCEGDGKSGACPSITVIQQKLRTYRLKNPAMNLNSLVCVGDKTCSGAQKCCSFSAFRQIFSGEGRIQQLVTGVCLEPASKEDTDAATESSDVESAE